MDPKTLANLDPKLRETYERVMGSSSPAPASPAPAAAPAVPPAPDIKPADTTAAPTPGSDVPSSAFFNSAPPPQTPPAPPSTPASPVTPVDPVVPIPPPSPSAAITPAAIADPFAQNPPAQNTDLTSLQPSLMGVPLKEPKDSELQLSKPLQPLPSPASVNQKVSPAAPAASSPSTLIRSLYIIAGVIFFIVYAIFWLKIFHYPLPF